MAHIPRLGMVLSAALVFASGCSVYPAPDDVARSSTFDIVQRVRCEAKAGLGRFALGDAHAQSIIAGTTIGYDFQFEITEVNNADGGALTLTRPPLVSGNSTFTLNATGSALRRRTNTRNVQFIEDLTELARAPCSPREMRRNGLYPIAGSLGMDEVVSTYIGLEKLSDLKTPTKATGSKASFEDQKVALFADTLEFRTKLSVGANPVLTLSAVAGKLKVTSASLNATARRNDVHTLIVALARDPKKEIDPKVAIARTLRKAMLEDQVVREPRTETALAQKDAERRTRVLLELKRIRNLRDDEKEAPRHLGEKLLEFLKPPPGGED
jgi:hypothetical protein